MKTVKCECGRRLRPCNLERHRRTHVPVPEERGEYTKLLKPRRPIVQGRNGDRRYDEAFPRGEGSFRFRIYRLRAGELQLIGAAPDPGGFGQGIFEMHREGEFITDDATGVLDTATDPGDWLVHPFALGRRKEIA